MPQPYPRQPAFDEFDAILTMVGNSYYGENANLSEWTDLRIVFEDARESGRFIITGASSDTPGFCGLLAFIIWPDTSVTMYRKGTGSTSKGMVCHDRHGHSVYMDQWYACDKDGVPWL